MAKILDDLKDALEKVNLTKIKKQVTTEESETVEPKLPYFSPLSTADIAILSSTISSISTMPSMNTGTIATGGTFTNAGMNAGAFGAYGVNVGIGQHGGGGGGGGLYNSYNSGTFYTNVNMGGDDLTIKGRSLSKILEKIEDRLAILENPDPAKLEKHAALKKAYDHYKMIEKMIGEN